MKKTWLTSTTLLFLTACVGATKNVDLLSQIKQVWDLILSFFALSFISVNDTTKLAAFIRIILFITVYVILYELLTHTVFQDSQKRKTATIISLAMSAMALVTLPVEVILSIGGMYGSILGAALLLGPILLIVYLVWGIPTTTKKQDFFKIVILTVLLWVLNAVSYYLQNIAAVKGVV